MAQDRFSDDKFNNFIDCWNIYSGLLFKSEDGINVRAKATKKYSEMCIMLGGKRVELVEGISVEPDYYPITGSLGEYDYIIGFTLVIFGKPMGLIEEMSAHCGKLFLSTDQITIGVNLKRYLSGVEGL